ncbi:unnamed protein product [Thelazia callipaeda]|uniref:Inhibitor_I29 domain-containing protein n=1 Tax=Thelazia callipaeda TaxID=103827 RepID=A0A0N5DBQ6_THECL|nr:unnamed protein product [Thelazia callipaeda]
MPILSALILLLLVKTYRQQLLQHFRYFLQWLRFGKTDNTVDYNAETMSSIIAEQARQRRLRKYAPNLEVF